jgi:hypothetical protein
MNMRIALGAALVFALGSAAAGSSFVNSAAQDADLVRTPDPISIAVAEVTPEMLANWKATAASSDYTPPRLPI